ncbi:MAG: aspartate/glutamate racemase family protein [Chlorobi bacterium]|nr:aspartate/glutamate racemase family protein [Chlorobiota bacterium]MCI0716446.1 aspartate/glutamate racemase family protein [Chlorobiota bacterium]
MKTLGLIGGTSWLSTIDYYRIINQEINKRLGGLNSAKIYLYSLNFEEFKPTADSGSLEKIAVMLTDISLRLKNAGAECIILCANTPHMVADIIEQKINIPLIHIAEVTAKEIVKNKIKTAGLLGTKFTMEQDFFKDRLLKHDIKTLVPNEDEREFIHSTIFSELGKNIFKLETKEKYLKIIDGLVKQGAEGVIFGCTEIPMLIKPEDCTIKVFDTTLIHARAAAEFALSETD